MRWRILICQPPAIMSKLAHIFHAYNLWTAFIFCCFRPLAYTTLDRLRAVFSLCPRRLCAACSFYVFLQIWPVYFDSLVTIRKTVFT